MHIDWGRHVVIDIQQFEFQRVARDPFGDEPRDGRLTLETGRQAGGQTGRRAARHTGGKENEREWHTRMGGRTLAREEEEGHSATHTHTHTHTHTQRERENLCSVARANNHTPARARRNATGDFEADALVGAGHHRELPRSCRTVLKALAGSGGGGG